MDTRKTWWFDVFFITLVAYGLYSIFLGSYPLINPDEGRYSDIARHMLESGNYVTPMFNGIPFLDKPVLFYWIQSFFLRLFGLNEWALRLWPITIATFGCVFTYITGRKLFNRRTGWLASIILTTSLFYFMMAHIADLDLTVAVFIASALFSFIIAVESADKKQRYYYWLAYSFAGLAILTKGLIGIVIPMMVIGLWILCLNRWKTLLKMRLISGIIIIAAINLPWFLLVQYHNPDFFHYFFYNQQIHRYLTQHFNSRHGYWFYPFILVVGTLPWSICFLAGFFRKCKITWKNRQKYQKHCFLLLWIISVSVFFSIPISKTMGYILPVFPAAALITASYLDTCFRDRKQAIARCWIITSVLLAIMGTALFFLHDLPSKFLFTRVEPELIIIGSTLWLAAIGLFFTRKNRAIFQTVFIPIAATLIIYPVVMYGIKQEGTQLGLESSKPLALPLKAKLKPNDIVIFYDYYYQDLSFYLDRDVLLAGNFKHEKLRDVWRQDFYEGLKNPRYKSHAMTTHQLQQLWKGHHHIYLFTTTKKMGQLKKILPPNSYQLKRYQNLILFNIPAENHAKLMSLAKHVKQR